MKQPEVLSAFYWRETFVPSSKPVNRGKRTSAQLKVLQRRALDMKAEGWTNTQIAERLDMSRRHVQQLTGPKARIAMMKGLLGKSSPWTI